MIDDKTLTNVFSHPITARVFIYLRQHKDPIGVRDVQRKLNLGSSSTSYWHLNKLLELGVVKQVQGNRYELIDEYATIKRIPLNVNLEHYIIGDKIVPGLFFILAFNFFILVSIIILFTFNFWVQAALAGFFSLGFDFLYLLSFYQKFRFKLNDNEQKEHLTQK